MTLVECLFCGKKYSSTVMDDESCPDCARKFNRKSGKKVIFKCKCGKEIEQGVKMCGKCRKVAIHNQEIEKLFPPGL